MDTDDLSQVAYQCLMDACYIADILGTEMGARARDCRTENEFLQSMINQIVEIEEEPKECLESYGLEEDIGPREFVRELVALKVRVSKVMKTPMAERVRAETLSSD